MDPASIAYATAAAAFLVGLAIVVALARTADIPQRLLLALGLIPGFAGLSYVGMALGIGTATVNGTTFVGLRYVDWLVTTPILVGLVGYVAGASRRSIAGVMLADALMIAAGAGAVLTAGSLKWALFGVSAFFHVSLFGYLYFVFPRRVPASPGRRGLFSLLKNHIGLLWLAYPFVWLMGPVGFGYATLASTALIYAYLDFAAKVPYVYFFYARRQAFSDDVISVVETDAETPPATAD